VAWNAQYSGKFAMGYVALGEHLSYLLNFKFVEHGLNLLWQFYTGLGNFILAFSSWLC